MRIGYNTWSLARVPYQDFLGGLAVIAIAGLAFWLARDLPDGTSGGMGPGTLPRGLAVAFQALS